MQLHTITHLIAASVAGLVLLAGSPELAVGDATGLSAYPTARLTNSRADGEVTNYDFVLGAVERTGGAMRAKRSVRLAGRVDRVTFEIPAGISTDEVLEHYRTQLAEHDYRVLFECRARDCGKSTVWANSVFGQATLYGPDRYQRYLAARQQLDGDDERLVAIYVTQRGNRKVYAHVESIVPSTSSGLEAPSGVSTHTERSDAATSNIVALLERDGFVLLDGVRPNSKGQFSGAARDTLGKIGAQLAAELAEKKGGGPYVVVCHLYGSGTLESVRASSERCAGQARTALDPGGELRLKIFGAGAYLPRTVLLPGERGPGERDARVELVAP
jgi:hypothetical protein